MGGPIFHMLHEQTVQWCPVKVQVSPKPQEEQNAPGKPEKLF